jgi:hypothetical protein
MEILVINLPLEHAMHGFHLVKKSSSSLKDAHVRFQ